MNKHTPKEQTYIDQEASKLANLLLKRIADYVEETYDGVLSPTDSIDLDIEYRSSNNQQKFNEYALPITKAVVKKIKHMMYDDRKVLVSTIKDNLWQDQSSTTINLIIRPYTFWERIFK